MKQRIGLIISKKTIEKLLFLFGLMILLTSCNGHQTSKVTYVFIEVPTEMDERKGGKSSIHGYRSIYYMIKVLLSMFMVALRPPKRK